MFSIELSTVKEMLGYDEDDETRDTVLTMLINGALQALKKLTGRNLEYGQYRDTFGYRTDRHYLMESPIVSVESVKLGTADVASSEYTVFNNSGRIEFRNCRGGLHTLDMSSYLTIEYTAGYQTLPADLLMAVFAAIQAADNHSKQQSSYGGQVRRITVADVGSTEFAVQSGSAATAVLKDTLLAQLGDLVDVAPALGAGLLHESELIED
jgi:hypothetical protein